jgi:hypothetical protein
MIGFVRGHVGSIGSVRRARHLHQSVAREGRQRRCCCYRSKHLLCWLNRYAMFIDGNADVVAGDQVFKGND